MTMALDDCVAFSNFQPMWNSDRIAIYDYDEQKNYTYSELGERADKLAAWLTKDLGLKKGDCIAFCARNHIAHFDAFFATYKTGVIITTYNHMLRTNELICMIQEEQPKVLFIDFSRADHIEMLKHQTGIETYVVLHGDSPKRDLLSYRDVMDKPGKYPQFPVCVKARDIQMYIHTGGTTGRPKAAMLSYQNIFYNVVSEGLSFGLNEKDVTFLFLPLFHTGGWNVFTVPILFYGGKLIIKRDVESDVTLKIIEEEKVTVGVAVPTIYRMLADDPNFDRTDFSHMRKILVGAAPVEENVLKKYYDRNIPLVNSYGMTEAGPNNITFPVTRMTMEQIKEKWSSVGIPMCFNEVKIVDDQDKAVPVGEKGELCFKGGMVFAGYLNNREETENLVRDGWVHTGDIAKQDEDGFIYIIDRKKNMVIVGGENVYPVEVERCLARFPGIKEACAYGVPDYKWGEVLKAIISLDVEQIDMSLLQEYIRKNLAGVKRPREIIIVDKIPKNNIGKINYQKIHELYD